MKRYIVEPEVAGHLGPSTMIDNTVHPPKVTRLEFVFDGWLGDPLLESFPCFVLRSDLIERFLQLGFTGFSAAALHLERSSEFEELQRGVQLPAFDWLRVIGQEGSDFSLMPDGRLVVSARVLEELIAANMRNAEVSELA